MRPERIVVEGFGTFRERVEIDFVGAELFALTGATGAGKSTVIDAIVFALYGSIPRLDDRSLVAPAISQDKVEAKVQLDFSVGGEHYTAVRVVRETVSKAKKSAVASTSSRTATTKEARLERRLSAHEAEVLAGTADELTAAVEKLLGLSLEHFTTCVVLPQGQFARFLHHKPRHRQDLLVELLDLGVYAEMASLARSRQKAAQQQVEWLTNERETLAFATPEAADACRLRVEALEALLRTLDETQPELEALASSIGERRQQQADAADCVQRLSTVAIPSGVGELAAEAAEAAAASVAAREEVLRTAAATQDAEDAREVLGEREKLEAVQRAHAELTQHRQRVGKGETTVARAESDLHAAQAAAAAARTRHDEMVAALDAARLANRAGELAQHLEQGQACPVCGNEVHEIPVHDAPALGRAEKAEVAARAAVETANEQLAQASATHTRTTTLLAELRTTVTDLEAQVSSAPTADDIARSLVAMQVADAEVKQAKEAERASQRAVAAADERKQGVDGRSVEAWRAFDEARDRVALMQPPAADRTDLLAAWQPLVAWAVEQAGQFQRAQSVIAAEIAELEHDRDTRAAAVADACASAGVDVAGRLPRDATIEALADAKADVDSLDAALARVAELETQVTELTTTDQLTGALARHLSASGFEKWVLDEALQRLVQGATGILHELSGGAYSLVLDGKTSNFFVLDHKSADAVRSARTLSGGETFLASLALALALADQVAEMAAGGAVRLESIFLDEGFGTLDPDTLDTVAAAIEELGARGRMVGLVSHVRELAERMPVRFVVTKGPSTSTVDRIDL